MVAESIDSTKLPSKLPLENLDAETVSPSPRPPPGWVSPNSDLSPRNARPDPKSFASTVNDVGIASNEVVPKYRKEFAHDNYSTVNVGDVEGTVKKAIAIQRTKMPTNESVIKQNADVTIAGSSRQDNMLVQSSSRNSGKLSTEYSEFSFPADNHGSNKNIMSEPTIETTIELARQESNDEDSAVLATITQNNLGRNLDTIDVDHQTGTTVAKFAASSISYDLSLVPTLSSLQSPEGSKSSQNCDAVTGFDITADKYDCGFSEQEITAGFRFVDLDKNGYIGAAEIRHILVAMGELITDEEVDMMITMLDFKGDGQVSLGAFRAMVKDPNPSRNDFEIPPEGHELDADADAIHRAKDLQKRSKKSRVLSQFVSTNKILMKALLAVTEKLKNKRSKEQDGSVFNRGEQNSFSWSVDFNTMCGLLDVEATAESKKVFELVDGVGSGKLDIRELLLSLGNFINPCPVEERCRFMFNLYDDDLSGHLSIAEIEAILMGNHMQSRKAISRKAQIIMKFVDTDATGNISFEELLLATGKFPNLLLPKHPMQGENDVGAQKETR